jgi:hypothetical protein
MAVVSVSVVGGARVGSLGRTHHGGHASGALGNRGAVEMEMISDDETLPQLVSLDEGQMVTTAGQLLLDDIVDHPAPQSEIPDAPHFSVAPGFAPPPLFVLGRANTAPPHTSTAQPTSDPPPPPPHETHSETAPTFLPVPPTKDPPPLTPDPPFIVVTPVTVITLVTPAPPAQPAPAPAPPPTAPPPAPLLAPGAAPVRLAASVPVSAIPEPATWAMMVLGFGAIALTLRRRRANTVRILRFAHQDTG